MKKTKKKQHTEVQNIDLPHHAETKPIQDDR
jgi:hypothetical protein